MESRRGLWHTRFVDKRPRDPVQLAKQVFDIAIGEAKDTVSESERPRLESRGIVVMADSYIPKPGKRGSYKKGGCTDVV